MGRNGHGPCHLPRLSRGSRESLGQWRYVWVWEIGGECMWLARLCPSASKHTWGAPTRPPWSQRTAFPGEKDHVLG